jgi:hypothetical protein
MPNFCPPSFYPAVAVPAVARDSRIQFGAIARARFVLLRSLFVLAFCCASRACFAASPDGTTIPSAANIVDSNGGVWTVDGGGLCYINGKRAGNCNSVRTLLFTKGNIYVDSTFGTWWEWIGSGWTSVSSNPGAVESPSGMTVPPAARIVDSSGGVWTLAGGVCFRNGVQAGTCNSLNTLLVVSGVIYARSTNGTWWRWTGSSWWSVVGDPRAVASASGTTIPSAAQITDATGGVWTLNGGVCLLNGFQAANCSSAKTLLFYQNSIYLGSTDGTWWIWNGSGWTSVAGNPQLATSAAVTNASNACLPFAPVTSDVLFASSKKVFAHYFSPMPLSIDNVEPTQDYYNINFLRKSGEHNKFFSAGGYLRQRPLPVYPSSDLNWRLINAEREVSMAIARGITGFTADIFSTTDVVGPNGPIFILLKAAAAVDSRFKIVLVPEAMTQSDVETIVQSVASNPAVYRLPDGRIVLSPWNASYNTASWWSSVLIYLAAHGTSVAFVPQFLGWTANAIAFSSISYGFSDWGTAMPNTWAMLSASTAHNVYGKIWMQAVRAEDYRPKDFLYWEASNSETFRDSWMNAISGGADWANLVTWSDFSESTEVEPYTDATLAGNIGTGYYNLNLYYATWFLTGHQPTISKDVFYYFYRREPVTAAAAAQTRLASVATGIPENNIELLAFLTSPGTLTIQIGGQTYTHDAPGGMTSFKVPLQAGTPQFSLSRNGSTVFSLKGGTQIYGAGGIPSGVQDLTYWSGSVSAAGDCWIVVPNL